MNKELFLRPEQAIRLVPNQETVIMVCDDGYALYNRDGIISRIKQRHLPISMRAIDFLKIVKKKFQVEGKIVESCLKILDTLQGKWFYVISNGEMESNEINDQLVEQNIDRGEEDKKEILNEECRIVNDECQILNNEIENEEQEEKVGFEFASYLSVELVEEYLNQYNLNRDKFNDYKDKLFYLVEFSLKDNSWDREEGAKRFLKFLKINKNFDINLIKIIIKLSSQFFDWLKDKGSISFNPIKAYIWNLKEKYKR